MLSLKSFSVKELPSHFEQVAKNAPNVEDNSNVIEETNQKENNFLDRLG
jgi:hypothetical protein